MQKIMMKLMNLIWIFLFQMDFRCANFLSNHDNVNVDVVFMSKFFQFIFTMVRHPVWILQFRFGPGSHLFIHSCTLRLRDPMESNITSRLWRLVAKEPFCETIGSCVNIWGKVVIDFAFPFRNRTKFYDLRQRKIYVVN